MRGLLSLFGFGLRSTLSGGSMPVLIVAGLLMITGFAYTKGAQGQREKCRTTELEAVVEGQRAAMSRLEKQLRAAAEARDVARAYAARDAAILEQEREEADAFKDELAARADHCPVSPSDAERLRRIGQ